MEGIIVDYLLQSIANKEFDSDEPLPSENVLSMRFSASRIEVRRAYTILADMGLVTSIHGKGRFLLPRPHLFTLDNSTHKSFTEKMKELGFSQSTITSHYRVDYDREVWNALGVNRCQEVFCISRCRVVEGEVAALHRSYIVSSQFPGIEADAPKISSMFEYFRSLGYRNFYDPDPIMSVGLPTPEEQDQLSCPPLVPIFRVNSRTFADSTILIQFSRISYRSDRIKHSTVSR